MPCSGLFSGIPGRHVTGDCPQPPLYKPSWQRSRGIASRHLCCLSLNRWHLLLLLLLLLLLSLLLLPLLLLLPPLLLLASTKWTLRNYPRNERLLLYRFRALTDRGELVSGQVLHPCWLHCSSLVVS